MARSRASHAHACAHAHTRLPLLSADELGEPDASFSLGLRTIGAFIKQDQLTKDWE